MNIKIGDILTIEYTSGDGKIVEKVENVTLESMEHYNKALYIVTFKEKPKESYVFSLKELEQFKETTYKQCEFCILDNEDNINTCTLYGKQAFDICISKEYIPNKNSCDRYKRKIKLG